MRKLYTEATIGVRNMSLTSEDLQQIDKVVKGAVAGLATNTELREAVSDLATKAELKDVKSELTESMSRLATKADLDRMEGRLATSIGLLQRDSFDRLDQHEVRITRLEKAMSK